MRRKRISWLPIIVIVLVGVYLKSAVMGTPRPVQQTPPVESSSNNTRPEAEPVPHVPQHTESYHSDPKQLYLKVVGVHDGDTITGLDEDQKQFKIRLDAIDAPELGMPFGQASRKALSEKVFGKMVEVIVKSKDRYGRTVGHVLLDKRDMNLEMLEAGMAWHYAHYEHNKRLAEAEQEARVIVLVCGVTRIQLHLGIGERAVGKMALRTSMENDTQGYLCVKKKPERDRPPRLFSSLGSAAGHFS